MQVFLIERRTFGNASDFGIQYSDSLNASVIDVLKKYFSLKAFPPSPGIKGRMLLATSFVLLVRKVLLKKNDQKVIAFYIYALLSTLSWLVLAKGHSYIHTHMNFVLFYFGWMQVSVYIVVNTFLEVFEKAKGILCLKYFVLK